MAVRAQRRPLEPLEGDRARPVVETKGRDGYLRLRRAERAVLQRR